MVKCTSIIILTLVCSVSGSKKLPITVEINGYKGVTIAISNTIPENRALIDRIKVIFTDASKFLYTATKNRLYFEDITIVVPKTWSKHSDYKAISGTRSGAAHVIVDGPNPALGNAPYVHGLKDCGIPAGYMHLTPYLIIDNNAAGYGSHDRIIVHEWGHLRWGLFDEYPTVERESQKAAEKFYPVDGTWKPNSCSDSILGQNLKDCSDIRSICILNFDGKPEEGCQFCPFVPNIAKASIMGYQWLPSIGDFCDIDDTSTDILQRHDSQARNDQNVFCKGRSAWEVMREHSDFTGVSQGPAEKNTIPTFRLVQEGAQKVVLVLDISGSMMGEPIKQLRNAVSHFLLNIVEEQTYVGIVTFNFEAYVEANLTEITSDVVRNNLVQSLPSSAFAGTSIGAGLQKGLEVLKRHGPDIEGSTLYLVSDGKETAFPYLEHIQPIIIADKVKVNTLAFGNKADEGIEALASRTGGSSYFYSGETNSTALIDALTDTDGITSSVVMVDSQMIEMSNGKPYNGEFYIDTGVTRDVVLQLVGQSLDNVTITATAPNGQTVNAVEQSNLGGNGKIMKLSGANQAGRYSYEIFSPSSKSAILTIQSRANNASAERVFLTTSVSDDVYDYNSTNVIKLFVAVQKGNAAVFGADVTAEMEDISGITMTMTLKDDGSGTDLIEDDGVYTAVILPRYINNGGRHSVKVKVTNENQRAYVLVPSGQTVQQQVNTPVQPIIVRREVIERFQRISQIEDFKVVNFTGTITEDRIPPGRITTLELLSVRSNIFSFKWKAVGDDFDIGTASSYDVRISTDFNLLRNTPEMATQITNQVPTPSQPGNLETISIAIEDTAKTYYVTVRAVDSDNNKGESSNTMSLSVTTDTNWQEQHSTKAQDDFDMIVLLAISFSFLLVMIIGFILVLRRCTKRNSNIESNSNIENKESWEQSRDKQSAHTSETDDKQTPTDEIKRSYEKQLRHMRRSYERRMERSYRKQTEQMRDLYEKQMKENRKSVKRQLKHEGYGNYYYYDGYWY